MQKIISHLFTFFVGMIATGFYYRLFVWPDQIERLQAICTDSDLGYPGDWVLDIFFPIIPLVLILGIILSVLVLKTKARK